NYDAGPYSVLKNNEFLITDPLQDREIKLRIIYPDAEGPFPVVVFSTGAFCSPQLYDRILDHWVSNGYIVVQPNHMDSPNNDRFPTMDELNNLFPTRMRDVSFILNSLDQIESGMNIQGRIQKDQLAISGHSFGAVISMVKTGLQLKPEAQGEFGPIYDDRFKAAVLLSGVGDGMDEFADNPFDGLRKPFIATGGSKDIGRVRPDKGMDGRQWRMQPYLLAPDLDKFSLITDGSDHYLGGLICNAEMGGKPDPESLAIVRAVTNVFLDAYLKNDEEALNYLKTADIQSLTGGRTAYIFNMKE
ncbi:MAG: hypothetical protein VYA80_07800, partial [Pseudomonadota bacterium]|nr:hypothetical protein [Pseudomonadota bacterium]